MWLRREAVADLPSWNMPDLYTAVSGERGAADIQYQQPLNQVKTMFVSLNYPNNAHSVDVIIRIVKMLAMMFHKIPLRSQQGPIAPTAALTRHGEWE